MKKKVNEKASIKSEALQEKALAFFKENPKAKKVFGTSDEFLFTNRKNAINHAQTLDNQEVFDFKNTNGIDVEDEEEVFEDEDEDQKSPSGIASTQDITK
jgi:hypothetical protein